MGRMGMNYGNVMDYENFLDLSTRINFDIPSRSTTSISKMQNAVVDEYNDFHIRHSVLTRFMIGQSNQPVLARARIELFKTFCYPTMLHQSSQNFFWLVLIDPGISADIIQEMTSLLTEFPSQNAYLILTNNTAWASDGISNSNPKAKRYGVDLQTIAQEYQNGQLDIRTGDTKALLQIANSNDSNNEYAKNPTGPSKPYLLVVETLLDADDGLHVSAIEHLQQDILKRTYLQQQQQSKDPNPTQPTLGSTWWIVCASEHLEWHNREIFNTTEVHFATHGISNGVVGRRATPPECISAGLTRVGYTTGVAAVSNNAGSLIFPKDAQHNHFATISVMPPCNHYTLQHCYYRSFRDFPGAFRSRSITSDSMSQLDPNLTYDKKNEHTRDSKLHFDSAEQLWSVLENEFYISRTAAQNVSEYLFKNRESILFENEQARCIPGFPCLEHSQKTIKKLKKMLVRIGAQDEDIGKSPTKRAKNPSEAKMVQPKTIRLHDTDAPHIKKRHQCIEAIRKRQIDLIGDYVRQYDFPSRQKALLVNPAYHANVGDHMITLGEIEFLRRVGVEVPNKMRQCGQFWQSLIPDCEKQRWWTNNEHQFHGMPALLHGGGNWGDLWRRNQDLRISSLETLLRKNFTIVSMPQSLYYRNETLKKTDAIRIEAAISPFNDTSVAKPTFLWREQYSFDQASHLYPSANNLLMPDIAFQLGPFQPLPLEDSDPRSVDIVLFLRADLESLESENRNRRSVRSILKSLVGKDNAIATTFKIVDWNDRLEIFDSDDILFSETAIQLLSMGRVLVCDRLHASILAYLSGIPFIYIDQLSGKISKTLGVALDSADGCLDRKESHFAKATNLTQALDMAMRFLQSENFD
jgi:exopolysaccharide biosynthesis predicted pyruvyltransferase EpsI